MDLGELTGAGRSTTDYWVRYSLSAMLFAGVFDRYPRLKVGSVEHEAAWVPHWLKQMDFTYRERPVFTKGWKSAEGGDFPHAESTWPKSREFLDRIFAGTPEDVLRKVTSENAARLFGFKLD
jgi:hypothetical protein